MRTVVLDDDPTGTQSASHVQVLLVSNADLLTEALRTDTSVYVLTNSRALTEDAAVALVTQVRDDSLEAARRLGAEVRFVLRGDSTLRGHVFAETEVFLDELAVMLFVPAFPAGGRTTVGGVHRVRQAGVEVPAHLTEFAADPVFPFETSTLVDYVAEKSGRAAIPVSLAELRSGGLAAVLGNAAPGSVVVPDAETDDDVRRIASAVELVRLDGASIVVRCGSPLAAALAGVESAGLLPQPLVEQIGDVLLVCGSHTAGATAQLGPIIEAWGEPVTVSTAAALTDPASAAATAAVGVRAHLDSGALAIVTTERERSAVHNTLAHGERVMEALTGAVRAVLPRVDVVVSKGGITSADTARVGLGATSARVLGQVLPGVSVWQLTALDGRERLLVVVPGNVGEPTTLIDVLSALGLAAPAAIS